MAKKNNAIQDKLIRKFKTKLKARKRRFDNYVDKDNHPTMDFEMCLTILHQLDEIEDEINKIFPDKNEKHTKSE